MRPPDGNTIGGLFFLIGEGVFRLGLVCCRQSGVAVFNKINQWIRDCNAVRMVANVWLYDFSELCASSPQVALFEASGVLSVGDDSIGPATDMEKRNLMGNEVSDSVYRIVLVGSCFRVGLESIGIAQSNPRLLLS